MAAQSPEMDDAPTSLSKEYNQSSIGHTVKHVLKHVAIMGAMMGVIGLASPAFAVGIDTFTGGLAADAGPTVGDLIVQTTHGAGEMLSMIIDTFEGLLSIGESLVSNTLEGNFAPSTWESIIMSHGGEHATAEMAGHAAAHGVAHGATETASVAFDEWVRNAHASGELPYALEDSEALGITLEEHMNNEYGHEGH